jgi:hypothetical protein
VDPLFCSRFLLACIVVLVNHNVELQSGLSVALLFTAYVLQQRYSPFVSSRSVGGGLTMSAAELQARLQKRSQSLAGPVQGVALVRHRSRRAKKNWKRAGLLAAIVAANRAGTLSALVASAPGASDNGSGGSGSEEPQATPQSARGGALSSIVRLAALAKTSEAAEADAAASPGPSPSPPPSPSPTAWNSFASTPVPLLAGDVNARSNSRGDKDVAVAVASPVTAAGERSRTAKSKELGSTAPAAAEACKPAVPDARAGAAGKARQVSVVVDKPGQGTGKTSPKVQPTL